MSWEALNNHKDVILWLKSLVSPYLTQFESAWVTWRLDDDWSMPLNVSNNLRAILLLEPVSHFGGPVGYFGSAVDAAVQAVSECPRHH